MDDPFVRRQIKEQPVLLSWVVNTGSMKEFLEQPPFSFGKAELLRRDSLSWYFALPDDGRLLAEGMLPCVIEWQTDVHPSAEMSACGCRLERLEIHHANPDWLNSVLRSINAEDLVKIRPLPANTAPYLKAYIQNPRWGQRNRWGQSLTKKKDVSLFESFRENVAAALQKSFPFSL